MSNSNISLTIVDITWNPYTLNGYKNWKFVITAESNAGRKFFEFTSPTLDFNYRQVLLSA